MRVPNLSALRAFEAAARHENFATAADELGVTPAAVSRSIQRLETEIGFSLFYRSHRSVSLSERGGEYAQRVTEAFRILAPNHFKAGKRSAVLNLDVEATFLSQWLLPRLKEQSFQMLELSLNIRSHEDRLRVLPVDTDLAIVWGNADYAGFRRKRLVSPKTLLVACPDLGVRDLHSIDEACLIHETSDHWWRLVYEEAGLPYPEESKHLTMNRCQLPITAAKLGLGMAVADDVIAEMELRTGALSVVRGPRFDGQDYYLMSRIGSSVPARGFATWLLEQSESFALWQRSLD